MKPVAFYTAEHAVARFRALRAADAKAPRVRLTTHPIRITTHPIRHFFHSILRALRVSA